VEIPPAKKTPKIYPVPLCARRVKDLDFSIQKTGHPPTPTTSPTLPARARAPKQITTGRLAKLATANAATLATLDENIPGSYLTSK
jgi:hypothetical protein